MNISGCDLIQISYATIALVLTSVVFALSSLGLKDLRHQSQAGRFLDSTRRHTTPHIPRIAQIH